MKKLSKNICILSQTNFEPLKVQCAPKVGGGCGRVNIGKYGQSHQLTVIKFLLPLARHSTLSLFISEVTNTETYTRLFPSDTSAFGCPHSNQMHLLYWTSEEHLAMPGLHRVKLPTDEECTFRLRD